MEEAGCTTEKERSPAAFPGLRPADILVHNLFLSRPAAINFKLWTRLQDNVDELDQAVRYKRRQYTAPCESEGWLFKPWGADTHGGLHPGARSLTTMLVKQLAATGKYGGPTAVSNLVWRAISTAVIHRAAVQLARHVSPPVPECDDVNAGRRETAVWDRDLGHRPSFA